MYLALLTFTVFIASSVSADEVLAEKILKLEAECNFYTRQTDNAILDEGGDMLPLNPGEDYFKCVNSLDNLKRQYISDNLLGLCLDDDTFPMLLFNGTVLMVPAPPEEDSDSPSKSPDFSHLEEMCIIHKTCSRILDDLLKSIESKKASEVNYFKIKGFYCMEILEKLKMKYIKENNMNVDILKALGELTVLCQEGRTSMSLPKPLKGGDDSTSVTSGFTNQADPASLKNSGNDDLNSSKEPMNGALYNEVDAKVHKTLPAVSKSPGDEGSQTPLKYNTKLNEKEIPTSGETGMEENAKVGSRNDDLHPLVSKERIPDVVDVSPRIPVEASLLVPEVDSVIESNNNWETISPQALDGSNKKTPVTDDEFDKVSFRTGDEGSKTPLKDNTKLNEKEIPTSGETEMEGSVKVDSRNDDLHPLVSKERIPDVVEIRPRIPVEANLLVPEVDNVIESNNNWETISPQALDGSNTKTPVTYDELETVSFQMKAVAAHFNAISSLESSSQVSEGGGENIDDVENNKDDNFSEANNIPDINNDNSKTIVKVDTDKVNTNDDGVRQSDDQTADSSSQHEKKEDKVESNNDDNSTNDTIIDNVEDNNKGKEKIVSIADKVKVIDDDDDDEKTITDKFIKNEKFVSGKDEVKKWHTNVQGNADDGGSKDAKVSIDVSGDGTGSSNDDATGTGIERGDVATAAGSSSTSTSPGVMSDHGGLLDNALPDDQQLQEPRLDYSLTLTVTSILDTLGDEIFQKEEDCKELLTVARKLLKHGSVSELDDEYTDCVNKLDDLKQLYIRKHGIDLEKYKTSFPVVLSTGTEELLPLPQTLESESLTAPSIQSAHDMVSAVEEVFRGSESLNDASDSDKKAQPPPFNPILLSNEKFLEYFNRKVPSDEEKN